MGETVNKQAPKQSENMQKMIDLQVYKLSCKIKLNFDLDFVKCFVELFSPLIKSALGMILMKSWLFQVGNKKT